MNQPMQIEDGQNYRVYLDGVIVPWWETADRVRGFVDVFAMVELDDVRLHRLFGVVTFEDRCNSL